VPKRETEKDGCQMKIDRDDRGDIKRIRTNGKCKSELDMIRNKNKEIEE